MINYHLINTLSAQQAKYHFDAHPLLIGKIISRYHDHYVGSNFERFIENLQIFESRFFNLLEESKEITF